MQIKARQIEIYMKSDGSKPFQKWLNALKSEVGRARIRARLDKVAIGNLGDSKPLTDGISELRLTFGPGYRIYYGIYQDKLVLLLLGGDKSTQARDIKKAKDYWIDYKERTHEQSKSKL